MVSAAEQLVSNLNFAANETIPNLFGAWCGPTAPRFHVSPLPSSLRFFATLAISGTLTAIAAGAVPSNLPPINQTPTGLQLTGKLIWFDLLTDNIAGFKQLAKFGPYLAGDHFSMADCAGWVSLPLVAMATKIVYGEDLLVSAGVDYKPYLKLVGERASAQRVVADRKAASTRP